MPELTDAERLAARDAEIELLAEELAQWKHLYESYCVPEDVAVLQTCRDEAVRRADEAEARVGELADENALLHAVLKERSDWSQRVWLAWCSARERARRSKAAADG
jgi:hypothetical protein